MTIDPVEFICAQTQLDSPSAVPEIYLQLASPDTPLWHMTEERLKQVDLPPPFWAFAWPGGQGMARYLFDHPEQVRGKRVLDFAAGSGIAAIAAMVAGAKEAIAVDIDPLALHAVELNAAHNKVEVKIGGVTDLTKPYTKADVILAGDICYDQAISTSVTRWLRLCVEAGVEVLIADPGRAYVPQVGMVKLARYDVPTSRDIEGDTIRTVLVWRMKEEIDKQ